MSDKTLIIASISIYTENMNNPKEVIDKVINDSKTELKVALHSKPMVNLYTKCKECKHMNINNDEEYYCDNKKDNYICPDGSKSVYYIIEIYNQIYDKKEKDLKDEYNSFLQFVRNNLPVCHEHHIIEGIVSR